MDHAVFDFINQQLANPFLDALLPWYRDKRFWVPLYVVLAVLIWRAYGTRRTLYLLLCLGLVIAVADQVAASLLKPWVGRLRPCAEPSVADHMRTLVSCGGKYGFPSNHATNHFAVATVLSLTCVRRRRWQWVLFAWALSICFAQVYVGKHYPGDILGGACLGTAVAILGVVLYRRAAGPEAIGVADEKGHN